MKVLCVAGIIGTWVCVALALVSSGALVNALAVISGGSVAIGYKFSDWGR